MAGFTFVIGKQYTREEVMRHVGVQALPSGGAWFTGYVTHDDAHFIFCGVGTAGRTGHDYGNHFDGDELVWSGRTGSSKEQPSIRALTDLGAEVHVFYREQDRQPFTYAGRAVPVSVSGDVPVRVRWRFVTPEGGSVASPDDVPARQGAVYKEGAVKTVTVNAYERNPQARAACIAHHGTACKVCDLDFGDTYGDLGEGFIHVHHVRPLATVGESYEIDPIADLVPVCPNCHAMLHRSEPPRTVAELRAVRNAQRKPLASNK